MEKLMKKDAVKKIALIILIVLTFNIIVPTYSNAGVLGGLLSKPLASLVMVWLNTINLRLSILFGMDTIIDNFKNDSDVNTDGDAALSDAEVDGFLDNLDDKWDEFIKKLGGIFLSPDDIFSGKIQIADANIFSTKYDGDGDIKSSDINIFNHLMKSLKETIAGLYYIMRNLAVVILLCLLIYCGIRIVLASNSAGEKAKWKEYLLDWLKALAIVMFVHIIMISIFYVVDVINQGLKASIGTGHKIGTMIINNFAHQSIFSITGVWIYVIMYAYLTYMNIVFLIAYFKRLVYVMFMITIAPIVGALYPLGKKGHQIFSKWFNEFLSGVMIQPFHYLIYTILLAVPLKLMQSGGATIAGTWGNVTPVSVQLYCLISIAMIRPIEKYARQIFQFGNTVLDNVASFESGKQAVDAAVKAGVSVYSIATGMPQVGNLINSTIGGGETGEIPDDGEGYIDYLNEGKKENAPYVPEYEPEYEPDEPQSYNDQQLETFERDSDKPSQEMPEYGFEPIETIPGESGWESDKKKNESDKENNKSESDNESDKGNNKLESDNELKLDSADIEINTANEMNVDNIDSLDANEMNVDNIDSLNANAIDGLDAGKTSEESKGDKKDSPVEEKDISAGEKDTVDGKDVLNGKDVLSSSVLSKLFFAPERGISAGIEKLLNKATGDPTFTDRYKQVLKAPETKEKLLDARAAMHEFVDSLYAPGQASGDWKNNVDFYNEQFIKVEKERIINDFVKSKDNIDKAIVEYNIKDKKDEKGNIVKTKEEQAEEKLKAMEPYVYKGIKDVHQIKALEDRGQIPRDAVKNAGKENIAVKHFMKRGNNDKKMVSMVLPKIPEGQRNNPQVIKQYVKQELEMGKQYIASKYAKDPETLNRLMELERKIDQKVELRGDSNTHKTDYVARIDKAIDKAVKDGVKNIKLPNSNKNVAVKKLETVMNDELKNRREANPPVNKKATSQINPPANEKATRPINPPANEKDTSQINPPANKKATRQINPPANNK